MTNEVFANGREVSCKKADGKSICAFPDVCMTPPENPATPPGVPVPYPNTGLASDTTEGSRSVQISGKEVMLKNKSYFKTSYGDEAGCAAKKGVVTSSHRGKVYFIAWSEDVKIEGENAVRHLDMTTHNHASRIANEAAPMGYVDTPAFETKACARDKGKKDDACDDEDPCPGVLNVKKGEQRKQVEMKPAKRSKAFKKHAALLATMSADDSATDKAAAAATAEADGSDCVKKSRCYLRPYIPGSDEDGCCPGQTGHHIPPKACFKKKDGKYQAGYSSRKALCVCMEGMNQHCGSHGKNHRSIEWLAEQKDMIPDKSYPLNEYIEMCAVTVEAQCECDKDCIIAQLNQHFEDMGITEVKHTDTNSSADIEGLKDKIRRSARKKKKKGR